MNRFALKRWHRQILYNFFLTSRFWPSFHGLVRNCLLLAAEKNLYIELFGAACARFCDGSAELG